MTRKRVVKPTPKRALHGADDLMRYTVSKGKESEKSSPLYRSQTFEMDGYHSKPNGGASPTKHGSKRKDFLFLKHDTTEK